MTTTTTAAGDTPGRTAGGLPPSVLDLLAAIRDAVNVPLPGTDDADERAWQSLMFQRLSDLHISLDVALSAKWAATMDPAEEAAHIRGRTAAAPVTYAVYERQQLGGAR